jgi:glycosyltransferase involved in cell wall biosynthesis
VMRIGIFDPYLDTLSGGEKYILSIASCLAKEHEVFIFWDKKKEAEIKQIALKKLGMGLSPIKFYKNIFDRNESWINRFVESGKFDAIIYLSDGSIPLVRSRLYVHFQFPIEWVNGDTLKTRFKLAFVKDIFCNSYFTKYFIDKKLSVNSKVLYPSVIINRNEKISKENIILHVGRFYTSKSGSNYKKQDVMIKVFKKMIDRGLRDWEFVIIMGVRDKDRAIFNKFKEMSKRYSIKIIDNPSNEILWENYSKAKIYWHATGFNEDLQKYPEKAEHFGISTVEAMGAGAVPVVINAGGQKEIIEDGKSGYLWNTLVELSDRTTSLIVNEKKLREMSIKAVKRSEIFNNDKFCKSLKNIIK